MNRVILMGRPTRDPEVRYSQGQNPVCIARYTLAVDRKGRRDQNDGPTADFIPCVAFGRSGEFAEKYVQQGKRILISGRIQTGSYTNRDGVKVYTTEVVVEEHEFADSPRDAGGAGRSRQNGSAEGRNTDRRQQDNGYEQEGFMDVPEGYDEGLPFN